MLKVKDAFGAKIDVKLNSGTVYHPGNTVKATVTVKVTKPINIYAIRVRLAGKEWTTVRKKEQGRDVLETQKMCFCRQLVTLCGHTKAVMKTFQELNGGAGSSSAGSSKTKLGQLAVAPIMVPPGTYVYPVHWRLPTELPPSFYVQGDQEDYAAVCYFVKAYVDIANNGKDSDVVCRKFFTVVTKMPRPQFLMPAPEPIVSLHKVNKCCTEYQFTSEVTQTHAYYAYDRMKEITFRVVIKGNISIVDRVYIETTHLLTVSANGFKEVRKTEYPEIGLDDPSEVLGGGARAYDVSVPLTAAMVPTVCGELVDSHYEVCVYYDVKMAEDPCDILRPIVTQATGAHEKPMVESLDHCSYPTIRERWPKEVSYSCPPEAELDLAPVMVSSAATDASKHVLKDFGLEADVDSPSASAEGDVLAMMMGGGTASSSSLASLVGQLLIEQPSKMWKHTDPPIKYTA